MFRRALQDAAVPVAARDTQGRKTAVACGQLRLRDLQGLSVQRKATSAVAVCTRDGFSGAEAWTFTSAVIANVRRLTNPSTGSLTGPVLARTIRKSE